jgi:glycosyltransferase involved in cell wall biosynthesis
MSETTPPLDRILMTADPIGGVWNFALELCGGLEAAGIEVILATMGAALRPEQRAELEELANVELVESSLKLEWMEDPWHDVSKAGTWLEWLEAQFAPDLIHLNGFAHGALPWTAPVVVTAHSDVLSWWRAVRREEAPTSWDDYTEAVRHGLAGADVVTAPSRAMLEALQRYRAPLAGARVIHNGRRPERYFPGAKEPFILSVGRLWDDAKNARALAAIAPELPWRVRLAGEPAGPGGERFAAQNVEMLGHCAPQRLVGLYSRAAIYAAPARYEPFGLSALEAGLSRCALVLGDIPSLREIWDDAALFVDPDDPHELRDVLRRLIEDPVARADLGARAQQRARTYTTERMVQGYLDAYATALSAAGPSPSALSPA